MGVSGFWSYSRQSDAADRGRIAELARLVAAAYHNLTGEKLDLFLDVAGNRIGVDWRQEINACIRAATFFVPVVTPLFHWSPECQRELRYFLRKARELGRVDLLMPIRYIATDYPDHPTTLTLGRYHWEDWTDLRLTSVDAAPHLRAVDAVASRLAGLPAPPPPSQRAPLDRATLLAEMTAAFDAFIETRPGAGDPHLGVPVLLDAANAFADALWRIGGHAAVMAEPEVAALVEKATAALNTLLRPVPALRTDPGLPEETRLLCVLLEAALVDARTTIEGWSSR